MKPQTLKNVENQSRKNKIFQMRLTEQELQLLRQVENELGITCSDYIRKRVFSNTKTVLINAKLLLADLDAIGPLLRETRNYFYGLLPQADGSNPAQIDQATFATQFRQYIAVQRQLEISMRKIIRLLKN